MPCTFTIGPITSATEPAAAVTMAGRPPRTDITRHSTIEATSATFGSTPETNENEMTSGISASAVMMPASDSRTKRFGARSTAEIDGESSNSDCVTAGVAICMGISGIC